MFQDALAKGLFPSMRKLAETLGVSSGNMTNAIKLAELPPHVVGAFGSPLDLQFRWALPLQECLARDPKGMAQRAERLASLGGKPSARQVFEALIGVEATRAPALKQIKVGRRVAGTFQRDAKGGVVLRLVPGALGQEQEKAFLAHLQALVEEAGK